MKLSKISATNDFHNVSDRAGSVGCLRIAPILIRVETSLIRRICTGMKIGRQGYVITGNPKCATGR